MGVNARLFKSGILCKNKGYVYNDTPASSVTATTSGDCGSGSYNSNGYVRAWNGTEFVDFVTFPTNPLNYTAAAAAGVSSAAAAPTTTSGKTYRSAEGKTDSQTPDMVAVYGDHGRVGYVSKTDLDAAPTSLASAGVTAARTITVWDKDGHTAIDTFTIQ